MKYLILLLFLSGCAVGKFPEFPESVQFHYAILVRDAQKVEQSFLNYVVNAEEMPKATQAVHCLKFEILSKIPYEIKFLQIVDLTECNLMGGYKPADMQAIHNWAQDVKGWSETRKKCFK
jgi:hypothetical protein